SGARSQAGAWPRSRPVSGSLGVVGQHTLDEDALGLVPGSCPPEEVDAGVGVLAGQQIGVDEPRVVGDRNVQVLPAKAAVAVRATGLLTEHALTRLPEAAELLGVDVQELAGPFALIATRATGCACGPGKPRAAMPAQHLPDCRWRVRHQPRQPHRPIRRAPAGSKDRLLSLGTSSARRPMRGRAAITQRRPPALPVTPPEPVARLAPPLAAASGGLIPCSIRQTISHRDSHDNRFRRGRSLACAIPGLLAE